MTRGLAFAGVAAALAAGLAAAVYGSAAGLTTLLILLPLGCATVFAAHAIVAARSRIGGLRRQFGLLAAVAAAQLAIAVGVFVALMFVSAHDAFLTVLVAGFAGALALWAARLLGHRTLADVDAVRSTLATCVPTSAGRTRSRGSGPTSTRWSPRWPRRSARGAA